MIDAAAPRILLVEDDENDVLFLQRAFDKAGCPRPFRVLHDGQEAISYLSGTAPYDDRFEYPAPSHLILDLKLPRRSGIEVLEWLRGNELTKGLPVVTLTSSGDPGDRERTHALGIDGYFVKPSRHSELIEIVKTIVSLWGLSDTEVTRAAADLAGPSSALLSLFPGDGEVVALMRRFDWAGTPLGPVTTWPEHLRSAVRICVTSSFPMWLWWGPEYTQLYNDAYRTILGSRHPEWLGRSGKECWRDIWPQMGPIVETVRATARAAGYEDLQIVMDRHVPREETYFTFSVSPILGRRTQVDGVFCVGGETTARVVSQRRLRALRDLAVRAGQEKDPIETCKAAATVLGDNSLDVPFALIYLADPDGATARLAASAGLRPDSPASPPAVHLTGADTSVSPWPLAEVLKAGHTRRLTDVAPSLSLPGGPWPESPRDVLVVAINAPGDRQLVGLLVAGASPRRVLDRSYETFFELAAAEIGAAVTQARAYQDEHRRADSLAELDRAKTMFFSNVSHEFRAPLTLLLSPLEDTLKKDESELASDDRGRIEAAHRNALRVLKLTNMLLDFARIEAGRIEAAYEAVDLAKLTSELAGVFRSVIERAGLEFRVDCPPLPEPMFVDREMWEKIVLNLLSNALKFTFEGEIELTLKSRGERVELAVRDTGTGIPEKELPRLFERFHRVQSSRSRTVEGSGIGLALVQEFARLHGATMGVRSEMGVGTTFTVSIPLGRAHLPTDKIRIRRGGPAASFRAAMFVGEAFRWLPESPKRHWDATVPPEDAELPADGKRPARILLADDNRDVREYVAEILGSRWTVDTVPNGAIALTSARGSPPDLIVADVMLPELDGLELLGELRSDPRTRTVPVILLSSLAGDEARAEGLGAGADDYLAKPFSARELLARTAALIELSRLRRAHERELARLNAELSEKVRDLEAFSGSVAHDLRSPLRTVQTLSDFLEEEFGHELPPTAADYLHRITASVKRMELLIESLLEYSRLTRSEIELAPVVAGDVAREVVEAFSEDLRQKHGRVTVDLEGVIVRADRVMLSQVLRNLISNALTYMKPGVSPEVRVGADRDAGRMRLWVQDNGVGIAPESRARLSEAFFRLNSSKDYPGSGLGLAIVRRASERMGGSWGVSSEVGAGSRFWVELEAA